MPTARPRTSGGTNARRKSATVARTPEVSGPPAEAREMLRAQAETTWARFFASRVAAADHREGAGMAGTRQRRTAVRASNASA